VNNRAGALAFLGAFFGSVLWLVGYFAGISILVWAGATAFVGFVALGGAASFAAARQRGVGAFESVWIGVKTAARWIVELLP
jgi:hypothetical protein